jgi:hypothetical protein
MNSIKQKSPAEQSNRGERGAALVMALLISLLLLAAGGALIMTTGLSAANAFDGTAETQAYYAAEAGMQATINVLRGNAPPSPLFVSNPSGSVDPQNKISFRKAVTVGTSNISGDTTGFPRLSRWLTYDGTENRVLLSPNYTRISGMAFTTELRDPDNSATVTFSTSGAFTNGPNSWGSGNNKLTLTYHPQASTTITNGGSSTLGYFDILPPSGNGSATLTNEPFSLTITQTAPWPVTATIKCTISGTFDKTSVTVPITFPATQTPSHDLEGVIYTRAPVTVNADGTTTVSTNGTTPISVTITPPQPNRLVVNSTGWGPRAAKKQLQALVSRFAFDFKAPSAITIRSADDNTQLTYNAGSSSQYHYSGYDNAGGPGLSAFAVTSTTDYNYLSGLSLPGGQVFGSPSGVQQINVNTLPMWLQTTDAARALVDQLKNEAKNTNRYFSAGTTPSDYGSPSNPLLTFVDGDSDLPPAGGAGLMVVTGTFAPRGSSAYDGLILVLGTGNLDRSGGGNGNSLGAIVVAHFGAGSNFLAPTFNSSGSGTSDIRYDSGWVRKALASSGPRVVAVSEY